MHVTGHLDLDEPFKGLFTQGMVVHETYKGPDGWVTPAEVRIEETDGKRRAFLADKGREIQIGSIEKMSKSKKNVVDPDDIIASYGADTARWFMLSDSPPDRDVIWTEAGVEGAHRFVQRVWRLISESAPALSGVEPASAKDGDAAAISKAAHKTVKAVGEDISKLAFNKAVARLYELVNVIAAPLGEISAGNGDQVTRSALRDALGKLVLMFAPMMPHLAEECWAAIGGAGMAANQPWPEFDAALVTDDEIVLPVQINGKKRGDLTIARDADQVKVEEAVLGLDFVRNALDGKAPRRVIVVPQRIVNVVI
jgi:leucyl-tRNA synthetase